MIYTVSNGSGGSPNVLIKTETGATVTLSKGDIVLTKVAENGEALFESVEYGTWTAVASLNGQTSDSVSIEVKQEIETEVPLVTPISDLQVGDKVKINGIKHIIKAKGHANYGADTITLITETSLLFTVFGSQSHWGYYSQSTIKEIAQQHYEACNETVRSYFKQITRGVSQGPQGIVQSTEYYFVPTSTEYGDDVPISGEPSNMGFNSNEDRSIGVQYWTASSPSNACVTAVQKMGTFIDLGGISASEQNGLRIACNLLNTTPITDVDSEGYYCLVGDNGVSELKDKSLEILGVKL